MYSRNNIINLDSIKKITDMNHTNYKNQTNSRVGTIRSKINPISILKKEFLTESGIINTIPNSLKLSE